MFVVEEDAGQVLTAPSIGEWQRRLSTALERDSGLDDAGRIESIRALEELVCTATAAQAALAAEFASSQRAEQERAGVPAVRRGRGIAAQVALARRESPHRGQRRLGLAVIVAEELPHTWAAWRAGRISEWKATLIARETACLAREDRLVVDEAVAGDGARVESLGERALAGEAAARAAELDPASVVLRRRRAVGERHVSLGPAPDCMTYLTAFLPVQDGVAVWAELTKAADAARASGDERGRGQVMADELVARALTQTQANSEPSAVPVALQLTMSDRALLCGDEESAYLEGAGWMPAELAREIVAGALSAGTVVSLRRLYTDPTSGELVAMESRARRFPPGLARFVRTRDQVCRTPWCDAPIRHIDHVVDHDVGGPTVETNGQGLCQACNHAKQAPGWRAGPRPGGGVETTTPTGHRYRSNPRVLARVRGTPLTMDYVLAG